MSTLRVGCIGLGNMGAALIKALSHLPDTTIRGFDPDVHKACELESTEGFSAASSMEAVLQDADFVFLAVKPQIMSRVLTDAKPVLRSATCIISIAAGITLEQLQNWSERRCAVVRVMPNTPAMVGSGVTAVCFEDPQLTEAQKEIVLEMLALLGQVHVLAEKDFHAFTALVGSGPAYVYYFMDALVQSGVSAGLSRPLAEQMVAGLLEGSVKLASETGLSLSTLQHMVTSPAGTTIAALNHLDRTATRGAVIDAVHKAEQRSRELGS
ncbi:pyrroline-5-carboxylate reductase [Desulfonatronum thiosulfatophilum]|uniref:Pyrroline-5-carboxylate reductase n=1 Tax=Desulfonatronum thiosulfatophilum TaxID=617002 RepID=A0A1G6DQ94_9BACT|nr:pyrroline-5-carboxylate reductase [Desulfonatronum thiosulfatophilum]SDB46955.1 pyrroline-5-carboxylate reductase [Desulfonatronum thiosulfatophilum]